jgi:hypothetical protein
MSYAVGQGIQRLHDSIGPHSVDYVVIASNQWRIGIIVPSEQSDAFNFAFSTPYFIGDISAKTKAQVVLTGGYLSSFSPPRPLGLVRFSRQDISSPIKTWLGAGIVCTNGAEVAIGKFEEGLQKKYPDCLQTGPLLIDNGVVRYSGADVSSGEQKLVQSEQEQTFICLDESGKIIMGVSDRLRLDDFTTYLRDKLKCLKAVRLSGSDTAGMVVGKTLYGHNDVPLFSAIAVFAR